jgi:hypothetical protein
VQKKNNQPTGFSREKKSVQYQKNLRGKDNNDPQPAVKKYISVILTELFWESKEKSTGFDEKTSF